MHYATECSEIIKDITFIFMPGNMLIAERMEQKVKEIDDCSKTKGHWEETFSCPM